MSKPRDQQPTPPLSGPLTGGKIFTTTPNSATANPPAIGTGGVIVGQPVPPRPYGNRGSEYPADQAPVLPPGPWNVPVGTKGSR